MITKTLCSTFCCLLIGCATTESSLDEVSNALMQRTGQTLATHNSDKVILPKGLSLNKPLSESELLTIALWNNAAFKEALTDMGLSHADLIQAEMIPNPNLAVLFPMNMKPLELTIRYPLELLWLRPQRIELAKLEQHRTAQRLVQTALDLIRDIRLAITECLYTQHALELATKLAALDQEIANLTQAKVTAGEATEQDRLNAQTIAKQSQATILHWQFEHQLALERLRHNLGLSLSEWSGLIKEPVNASFKNNDSTHWLKIALASRPDLYAAELALKAAAKRVGLAEADILTFAATPNAKEINNRSIFAVGAGFDVTLPIFNQNQGNIAIAKANFDKLTKQYITVRNRIALQVREASNQQAKAQSNQNLWQQQTLPLLQTSLHNAEQAYKQGNVSYLFVQETRRKQVDAELKAQTYQAEWQRAVILLEHSVGRNLN